MFQEKFTADAKLLAVIAAYTLIDNNQEKKELEEVIKQLRFTDLNV